VQQQHQQQVQGGMVYNNTQYRPQQQQQQQQGMMTSPPQYQQQPQTQQPSPYNFAPPPQPLPQPSQNSGGMGFAQRSAMMQPQQGGAAYGNPQQQQQVQQQPPQPPVAQINVPIRQQPQQSNNMYGGGGRAPVAPAPGSYAQRYQAMQQQQNQQQQPSLAVQTNNSNPAGNNSGSIYSPVARGSNNLYPPSPSAQQRVQPQQQPPQAGAAAGGSFAQRQAAMMGQGGQPQIQESQIQKQQQPQAPASGSFAQRQAAMMGQGGQPQNLQQQQQQFQQPGQLQQQQQQQQGQQPPEGPPMPPQPPQLPIMVDPPEVIARQQRLLTEATRKVQEHAYYMKQAIDRHDLPVVLDRAASMVGELGEHAHSHNNHKLHPPAPGASGTSTALQPKNYYELHLRALEELPTLENYLLDLATASKQQGQLQQQGQQQQQQQGQQQQPPQQQQQQQQVLGGAPAPVPVPSSANSAALMQQLTGGAPVPVPSSANSAALMQQLTGDPNATAGGGNFMNAPPQQQPPPNNNNMNPLNSNPNNPLGPGPGNYNNVMGGNNGSTLNNNNPMMANTQNPQMGMGGMGMGMGMTNNGMMNMQQQQQQQQQSMINSSSIVPPTPAITYTMMELYDCVQYCPNVLSRLYLQICAASALIRSGEVGARWVFKDLIEAVKCVQNPVRGLFLRHYLLQAFRDKLPDVGIPIDQIGSIIRGTASLAHVPAAPTGENVNSLENVSTPAPKLSDSVADMSDPGTVKDSYEFVLVNFIEMNKLWVRIQHLPGDQRTKAVRRRREKDRNELRILVGTNLVRLSALDSITSTIYGQVILPTVLDQIVICADPLSQAYLLDCIVQVFPDEYHIETMPILLAVCPKLRDKVNIRTILGSLMTRLANYFADEELLDEKDSNQVKRAVALDSFRMFDECVQNVYNARGPKLNAKEVIRLQTALLEYSMKCYKGNLEQITLCLKNCVLALQQERDNAAYMMPPPQQQQHQQQYGQPQQPPPPPPTALEPVATKELEKLLSIPLEELALGVLTLDHYSDLIAFLPWNNRRELALNMLESVIGSGKPPESVKEIEELFSVIAPVLRGEHDELAPSSTFAEVDRTTNLMAGLGVSTGQQQHQSYAPQPQQGFNGGGIDPIRYQQDSVLVSKFIGMLDNADTDVLFEMLSIARKHISVGHNAAQRSSFAHSALVFESLKLARRVFQEAHDEASPSAEVVVAENEKVNAENASEEETEAVASSEEPETSKEKNAEEEEGTEEAKVENVEEGEADVDTTEQAEEDTKSAAKEDDTPKEAPQKEKVVT
jgi:hypothetical protein